MNAKITTKLPPTNGQIVYIQGFEFIANNVRIVPWQGYPDESAFVCRFTGVCTDSPRNDSIRHTAYNGGTYGWKVS